MTHNTQNLSHKHFRKWANVVPWHTEQLFQKYPQELDKVKIEGWEVKQIELKKLSQNSLCQHKASKDVLKLEYTWTDSFLNNQVISVFPPSN